MHHLALSIFYFVICCSQPTTSYDVSSFLEKMSIEKPLEKLIYDNDTRMLFVAGLEGAGHHAFADMFEIFKHQSFCKHEYRLSELSVSYSGLQVQTVGLFAGQDGGNNSVHIRKMLRRMNIIAKTPKKKNPNLFYLGLSEIWIGDLCPGMLSYPNGPSPHKSLDRPDMFIYAALAETALLDMRFIVLLRSADATLHSTIDHRHFGNKQPQILISNAEAIYAQMSLLSAHFYKCVNYEDLVGPGLKTSQKQSLVAFLHPRAVNRNILDQMLGTIKRKSGGFPKNSVAHRASMPQINVRHNETLNRAYHALQLQTRLNLIKQLCTKNKEWIVVRHIIGQLLLRKHSIMLFAQYLNSHGFSMEEYNSLDESLRSSLLNQFDATLPLHDTSQLITRAEFIEQEQFLMRVVQDRFNVYQKRLEDQKKVTDQLRADFEASQKGFGWTDVRAIFSAIIAVFTHTSVTAPASLPRNNPSDSSECACEKGVFDTPNDSSIRRRRQLEVETQVD